MDEELSVRYNGTYKENVESRLAYIKAEDNVFIFSKPNVGDDKQEASLYRDKVYYIKRKAVYNNELFYLLSEQPSAQIGVIGWIKASYVKSVKNIIIDYDPKLFYLNGEGKAYNHPWGKAKNCIYGDLMKYRDSVLQVDKTELVRKKVWYHGSLDDVGLWIDGKYVVETKD